MEVVDKRSLDTYLQAYSEEQALRTKLNTRTETQIPDWQTSQAPSTYRTMYVIHF